MNEYINLRIITLTNRGVRENKKIQGPEGACLVSTFNDYVCLHWINLKGSAIVMMLWAYRHRGGGGAYLLHQSQVDLI